MSKCLINGHMASRSDFKDIRSILSRGRDCKEAFADNDLTAEEIKASLDSDMNGVLTHQDLSKMDIDDLAELKDILKRHDLSFYELLPKLRFYDRATIPAVFWKDREFVLNVAFNQPWALCDADEDLREDKDFVIEALLAEGATDCYCEDESLEDDPVLEWFDKCYSKCLGYCDRGVFRNVDGEFDELAKIAEFDLRVLWGAGLSEKKRAALWERTVKHHGVSDFMKKNDVGSFEEFRTLLKDRYGIAGYDSFRSLSKLCRILEFADDPLTGKGLPVAALVLAKSDHNGILKDYPIADRLVDLGFMVRYKEAGNEEDVELFLNRATEGGKNKLKALLVAGHGNVQGISLGHLQNPSWYPEDGPVKVDERLFLDVSDLAEKPDGTRDVNFEKYLDPTGDLLLISCLVGYKGIRNAFNLTNEIARTLAEGISLQSFSLSDKLFGLKKDERGRLVMKGLDGYIYTTTGRKKTGEAAISK